MPASDADEREIIGLTARYNWALDIAHDAEAVADTFTPDGRFQAGSGAGGRGRDELIEYFRGSAERLREAAGSPIRHWLNSHLVDVDGDEATHSCYILFIAVGGPAPRLHRSGVYQDRLRRTGGRWRFSERRVVIDTTS